MTGLPALTVVPMLIALYVPFCAKVIDPAAPPSNDDLRSLWEAPVGLAERDLFFGPWGPERAPDPRETYTLVERKHTGVNPGMTVRDSQGRVWSVKQAPPLGQPSEGPIEVVMSRVLSAIGYHQPPVYFLPAFTLVDDWGSRIEAGGRFRLKDKSLKGGGSWSWQRSPLVGTKPYQGLLVVLLLFNSSDLKNSNNTRYAYRTGDRVETWYVVRDLGTALGTTGRLAPRRGDAAAFAREPFITGLAGGFVEFGFRGWHQELVRGRITAADVQWAGRLLAGLTDQQWNEAFRAGGFTPGDAAPFIDAIKARIRHASIVGGQYLPAGSEGR
ncbi:MAG: hypothetical protein A3J29_06560 [Acidobacteria bacterium RIFCSPLOWO2_12_FULL_67_14b]|nr:MAG: hypothetical protein A3J29_06560 [Acidobacteria bacterium RIFCSPLOWO2_12_FULL_67_14b]